MTEARQPQDRRRKSKTVDPVFSFELDGETYTFTKPTGDVVTPGWLRKNRHLGEDAQFFTILEALADDETLEVVDEMKPKEFRKLYKEFFDHLGADRGE